MTFIEDLGGITEGLECSGPVRRAHGQIAFAWAFAELFSDRQDEWQGLARQAAEALRSAAKVGAAGALDAMVAHVEGILVPIAPAAKEYVIHTVGHAHIDMDWSWPWIETITICRDTFVTVDRLMDEFPEFRYSQSQVSVYKAMEDYFPEVFDMIASRIREGRWEVTASMWVEGDKNMASGESLCRHILYSKRYLRERFGLPYDAIRIDWEGDAFGHAHTLPSILSRGGVTRYYHCRTGPDPWLLRWQAPDGSRALRFYDKQWYGGHLSPKVALHMVDYAKETGLRDFMFVCGVSDHGGGPTRADLRMAVEMQSWPIFPNIRLSTTDAFYDAVEAAPGDLAIHDGELNCEFEGCYTSQSKAKLVNRRGETMLPEAETISLIAACCVGFGYEVEQLRRAWEGVLFNQFHDILAGSSEHEAMEEAVARFRESEAIAGAIRIRALRRMAEQIDTLTVCGLTIATATPDTIGYGAGDFGVAGGVSALSAGNAHAAPIVVFNALPYPRSEMVAAKVWDRAFFDRPIAVRDQEGRLRPGQVIGKSRYGDHESRVVLLAADDVPAGGYKTFALLPADQPIERQGALVVSPGIIENEHLRVEVDIPSGAVRRLVDKPTAYDCVPDGELMGVLELYREAPHNMSAWEIGEIVEMTRVTAGGVIDESERYPFLDGSEGLGMVNSWQFPEAGPNRAAVRVSRIVGGSRVISEIALSSGSRQVEYTIIAQWTETGSPQTGVPMLRIAFPVRLTDPKATYEIPFGSIERPANGQEVPALRWADLSGGRIGAEGDCGITVLNDCKYGHSAQGNIMRVTLLRSSYDPDPVPEMCSHKIRFAIVPHDGGCSRSQATRVAAAFNQPMNIIAADLHEGPLPPSNSFAEVLTPNVVLACLKRAEDSDAVIVRLYEVEGRAVTARVRLTDPVPRGARCTEVDMLEQPLARSTARMSGDTLEVEVPAHGIATVMIG
jgi:alpha-mannosidase